MLHELLFALLGRPGSIIKDNAIQFKVDCTLKFLNRPEVDLTNQLAKLGYHYKLITHFISQETLSLDFQTHKQQPSAYRKAMAFGLKQAIHQYESKILQIEQTFLQNRYFTLSTIKAQLYQFEIQLRQMVSVIDQIRQKQSRGGSIVNVLQQKYESSNEWVQKWLRILLKECYKVFMNMFNAWIFHGEIININGQFFIHEVISQSVTNKYKFARFNKNTVKGSVPDITDWDMYTIEEQMIPTSLIRIQTAGKILFIGKSVKILKNMKRMPSIPEQIYQNRLIQIMNEFNTSSFQKLVEEIRHKIATEMVTVIMKEQNLIKQLQKINNYYLMFQGDFYHHLLEEAKPIQNISQKERVQKKLNQTYLQNTFMRLGNYQDVKRISFQLKPLGFTYLGFRNFNKLCPVGSIRLVQGGNIKFNSCAGLWNRTKQAVDNSFFMSCTFRFKKIASLFVNRSNNNLNTKSDKIRNSNIALVIQNCKPISNSFHENSSSLTMINEYLGVHFGFITYQKTNETSTSIALIYKNQRRYEKQIIFNTMSPKNVNFQNEELYILKLNYTDDILKVSVVPKDMPNTPYNENTIKAQIKLSHYLSLQMGRAHVGFITNLNQSLFCLQLKEWQMICRPINHYGDHWSDISINLSMKWPLNLILTPDLMQNFLGIHKFLFPVRQVQIDIQSIWVRIPRIVKEKKCFSNSEATQMKFFQRNLAKTRSDISLTLNSLWNYFQSDTSVTLWNNLKRQILQTKDYESIIEMVAHYARSLQTMYFFHVPKIQKLISRLISQAKKFVIFFNSVQRQEIDRQTQNYLEDLGDNFQRILKDLLQLLKDLSKINSARHLYHLTERIEICITTSVDSY